MSARLAKMLGKPEAQVAELTRQMENKFGYPSHDVRLLAEVNLAVKDKIASLGLDPHDTTAQELYHGLQAKFADDASQIDKALGAGVNTGYEGRIAKATQLSKRITGDAQVWILKPTAAKKQLISLPPKKLMKQLHYRTLTSMLKREDISELYSAAMFVESSSWQSALAKAVARRASSDYSLSRVNFVQLQASRYDKLPEPSDLNFCNKLTGSVGIWPAKSLSAVPVITLVSMLLQSVRRLGVNVDKKAIIAVHPAMQWWANTDHLVSPQTEGSISLNIHDVAHNHLNSASHDNSVSHHGAKALWTELMDRYQSLASEAQQFMEDEVETLMPSALAAEYQEA